MPIDRGKNTEADLTVEIQARLREVIVTCAGSFALRC